jgi:hypothetical protein
MSKKRFQALFDPKLILDIKICAKQNGFPSTNNFIENTMRNEVRRNKKRSFILKLRI